MIVILSAAVAQGAHPIAWDGFSGSENWIDFGNFYAQPNPTYYEGCTFTEQGDGLGVSGWQFGDHSMFFETGQATYPGLSLGGSLIDGHGRTEIRIDFTDFTAIRRVGILAATSLASTWALEAYDAGNNLLYSRQETMPADSTPVWIGFQTDADISYVLIVEPSDNGYYALFDDLRFEVDVEITDSDGDGIVDAYDLCPGTPPGTWVDPCGCPIPDTDGDGVFDPCDDCPGTPPATQVNDRGCPDADGDGVQDADDLCPGTPPGTPVNPQGCIDTDQDGVTDPCDACPGTPPGTWVDATGCPVVFVPVMSTGASGWADYNNDGYSDMFSNTDVWTNNGDGTFTQTTPFAAPYGGFGSLGDYNNDGLVDHFSIGTYAGGHLYLNNGDETWTFRDDLITWEWHHTPRNSNGQTCVDLNGDGYLDTYMTGWWDSNQNQSADVIFTSFSDGVSDPCWRKTWEQIPYRHCKGATPCDFDEDGDQDLYVSGYWMNYGHLWRNDSFDGTNGLTDVTFAYGANDGPGHTQGSCWADFDNDGHFDLFIANFAHPGNPPARFMNSMGEPSYAFADRGLCGVTQVEPLSCGIAGDYDNDGDVDLLVTVSGGYSWQYIMLYENDGSGSWAGSMFTEVTSSTGLGSQGPQDVGAWGDYNNDGFLDLIANGQLWKNPGGINHWLKVKLLGGPHVDGLVNGSAIGAQVRINVPGLGTLVRQVEGNTGQLGCQNDLTMHFGLGSYTGAVDLEIDWPNGHQEIVYDVAVDQAITVQLEPPVTVPPCWDYPTQCHGDCDGSGDVDTVDWPTFRDAFGYAYPDALYNPCGDLDHDGDVDTADWPEFRDNFGFSAVADCPGGGTWPPTP